MSARRRIPLVAALLAAALAPPALAADAPSARANARGAAAGRPGAPQGARSELSPRTVSGKDRQPGTGQANVPTDPGARTTRPGAAARQPGTTRGATNDRAAAQARSAEGRSRTPAGAPGAKRSIEEVARGGQAGASPQAPVSRGSASRLLRANGLDVDVPEDMDDLAVRMSAADEPGPPSMSRETPTKGRPRAARPAAGQTAVAASTADEPATRVGPTTCAASLQATPTLQYERARASLREFWWSDMARFFESSLDETEPQPTQVTRADTLPAEEAIRRSGLQRKLLEQVARARSVDLLSERELAKIGKALSGASPSAIGLLLRADSPTLRAHVWTWLATTPAGVCTLARIDRAVVDAAIRDRSVAVEHGEDLIFRPLGDYALAARARVAAADPQNFDALLRALWSEADLDPRVRAVIAGLRVRRGHAGSIEQGLVDPAASIRGAVAAASLDRDRELYEPRMLEHAASDPADLVTELIVGELLGGPDGTPRGGLATSRDPRIRAALNRWRGRGDPMAPLPAPDRPLKFAAPRRGEPKLEPTKSGPARSEPRRVEPRVEPRPEPPRDEPEAEPSDAPQEEHPETVEPARPGRRAAPTPGGPQLPGVLDDPSGSAPLP